MGIMSKLVCDNVSWVWIPVCCTRLCHKKIYIYFGSGVWTVKRWLNSD